jgi:predicted lipoprotein
LLRYVQVSIAALDDLADLDDPTFANVALPQGRIRVEVLQKSIEIIALLCGEELRPALGMVTGFNAMDGD